MIAIGLAHLPVSQFPLETDAASSYARRHGESENHFRSHLIQPRPGDEGTPARELIDMAVAAENSGLVDAIWVGDSILSKPRLECIPLLGAIAAHTSRVKLGVACMATIAQRNPVLLALQWASLDVLSGGRTWLAACMGYPASQHPMAAKELEVMGIAKQRAAGAIGRNAPGPAAFFGPTNTRASTASTIRLTT